MKENDVSPSDAENCFNMYLNGLKEIGMIVNPPVQLIEDNEPMNYIHFHRAAEDGDCNVLRCFLMRSDLEINKQDKFGDSALHNAARENKVDVVQLLLSQNGIVLELKNKEECTAVDIATNCGHDEIVAIIQNWANRPKRPPQYHCSDCEFPSTTEVSVTLPRKNKYRIGKILGEGAFGKVYEAFLIGSTSGRHSTTPNAH